MTLDDVIPAPQFRERHERRIAAPPDAVWTALYELRLGDSPLALALMAVRGLPGVLVRRRLPPMVTRPFLEQGPVPVLAADPARAVIAGGLLQPWRLTGGDTPPELDAAGLRAFSAPGWVKCGVDFVLAPEGDGTRLSTETRARATDHGARIRFALYWLAIRAGSDLIRREMLRLVARRAEAIVA